jgi:hypothetical protein
MKKTSITKVGNGGAESVKKKHKTNKKDKKGEMRENPRINAN